MTEIRYEHSGLDSKILRAVTEMGFETMTPIQAQAVPVLLEGKDIIGQAQTGTGKTAAFGIPLLQNIDAENKNVQAIVLCPTRELAIQAAEEMRKFAKFMHGIKILPVYGGQDIGRQIRALKGGIQVIVGTPGRVMDHMRRHTLKMDSVRTVVLDEADEMLNMGFREDMETILKEVPEEHQTALFSATMPQAILDITSEFQKDAVMVRMPSRELTVDSIKQYYLVCKKEYREELICRLKEIHDLKRSLIFCNTKKMVDDLAVSLKKMGYRAEGLHGDLTQKQRDFVMSRFRTGNLEFLIATDVAARGIDVDNLEAVFNYDVPQDIEYYVHRIGRTGRAGKGGLSFTFINGREMSRIREIERVCKTNIERYQIPDSRSISRVKADKVLQEVSEILQSQDLSRMKEILEEKIREEGWDPLDAAAAFLKMHVGEEAPEIPEERIWEERRGNRQRKGYGRQQEPYQRQSHSRIRIRTEKNSSRAENHSHSRKPQTHPRSSASITGNSRKRQNRAG
ncbi:MAG: DEAD/DEAH box helicase [Candidatus Limivivens sp.]|nr:DEAD/DEAH box helicase [Candidatus Limivivens sp.]